jgi:hypothetical protein
VVHCKHVVRAHCLSTLEFARLSIGLRTCRLAFEFDFYIRREIASLLFSLVLLNSAFLLFVWNLHLLIGFSLNIVMGLFVGSFIFKLVNTGAERSRFLQVWLWHGAEIGELLGVRWGSNLAVEIVTGSHWSNRLSSTVIGIANLIWTTFVSKCLFVGCFKRHGWIVGNFDLSAFHVNSKLLLFGRWHTVLECVLIGTLHAFLVLVAHLCLTCLNALYTWNARLLFTSFL